MPHLPKVHSLGTVSFKDALALQLKLRESLINNPDSEEHIIFCEHTPIITVGRRSQSASLLVEREKILETGTEISEVNRGGDVTWHGPGQLVCYPILDLNRHRRDVHWYMRQLEEVVMKTLQFFSVPAMQFEGRTGVWTDLGEGDERKRPKKICSIGVHISRWCTIHGLALNVLPLPRSSGFTFISPCGFNDIDMTALWEERTSLGLTPVSISEVQERFLLEFCELFGFGSDMGLKGIGSLGDSLV